MILLPLPGLYVGAPKWIMFNIHDETASSNSIVLVEEPAPVLVDYKDRG